MREFGSEHPAIILPDNYFSSFEEFDREVIYLRSGRESLLYVSCNCKPGKDAVILFPAYCCWSMSAPFVKSGWSIVYYRINEDLTVDLDYLIELLKHIHVDAILTMNFFGSSYTNEAIHMVKDFNPDIIVIEDFSHCTFSLSSIFNPLVDYYVSSLRKSIGICDGAVVLSKHPTNKHYIQEEQPEFSDRRINAQLKKGHYLFSKDQNEKSIFLSEIRECESILNGFNAVRPISQTAMCMLKQINGKHIANARRVNMKHLMRLLETKVDMVPGLERSLVGAPFSLPIVVRNRDEIQKKLAKCGVYAPVLWPISEEARRVCENSAKMADSMLSLPIDQRYDWDDIEDIAQIVTKYCV